MSIKAHEQTQQYSPTLSTSGQQQQQKQHFEMNLQQQDMDQRIEENCENRNTNNLQSEIKELKRALSEKENQLMECLQENDRQVELEDSIIAWQDKYERLYESHKRVQKVNQTLEDKLLKLVERGESKNAQLTSDVATLSVRLAQANYNISLMQREIERYKADMGLAIQLLQCKPDGVVSSKISSHLPIEIQNKLRGTYMRLDSTSHSDSEGSTHSAGLLTNNNAYTALPFRADSPSGNAILPPCTSIAKRNDQQITISPSVMVKFLEDELKASQTRHCDTCKCPNREMTVVADIQKTYSIATQTHQSENNLCIRCSNDLNSPSHVNSPFAMKLVKSSDSVISETKSSVSNSTQNEKLFSPAKKDDLAINPILGHHHLCDRANNDFLPLIVSPKISSSKNHHISSSSSSVSKNVCSPVISKTLMDKKTDVMSKNNDNYESHENMAKISSKFNQDTNIDDVDLLNLSGDPINDSMNPNDTDNEADLMCNEKTFLLDKSETIASPVFSSTRPKSNNLASRTMILRTPELNHTNTNNKNNNSTTSPAGPSSCSTAGKISSESYAINDTDKVTNKSDSLRGAGNGSTNSLWSRTSSRDGYKMFENFNRNLIKTIKAENPKMKGPRICALRIQTGSNNIVLDDGSEENTEVISPPVVYTRRPRLLDEELDDEKDVTLAYDCKISMVMSDIQKKPIILNEKLPSPLLEKPLEQNIPLNDVKSVPEQQQLQQPVTQQPPHQNYSSYSRTPNDSMLSEVDLKRQQLSRVAEWVQNNSKINEPESYNCPKETEGDLINLLDTQQTSFNHDQNRGTNNNCENTLGYRPEKCLLDSNLSLNMNVVNPTLNTTTKKPIEELAQHNSITSNENFANNSNSNNNNNSTKNNSINLYKYFKLYSSQQSDFEDDDDLQYDNGNDDDCCDEDYDEEETSEKNLEDENQIDLAQMEYNVKQFLLKQNEWSIHNKLAPGGARLASSSNENSSKPHRTETNL
uniref:CSON010110 protein n=1 Tax=Culicoides sonorensis TaxID=179676 RepID=A0A336LPF2_CULSO